MSLLIHDVGTCEMCGAWFVDDDGFQSRLNMHIAIKHTKGSRKRFRDAHDESSSVVAEEAVEVVEGAVGWGEFSSNFMDFDSQNDGGGDDRDSKDDSLSRSSDEPPESEESDKESDVEVAGQCLCF
jgi:hypothetical protein